MSTATITFDIDGQTVAAEDAVWYQVAPCGCTCGVSVVTLSSVKGYSPKLTEDSAWEAFYSNAEQRRRDKAAGFRIELGFREDITTRLKVKCGHVPQWGVPEQPMLEGWVWAGNRAGRRAHLVPGDSQGEALKVLPGLDALKALCGKADRHWGTFYVELGDLPTCRKCEAKARGVQ